MRAWISRRKLTRAAAAVGALLFALLALRAWDAEQGPPLRPWHTVVPEELHAAALDTADWAVWLAAEQAALDTVRTQVTERLAPEDRIAANRYFAGSPLHPGRFPQDWNRSFVLLPEGEPRGAVALLHGLTDAPYSLRHVAQRYRALGFVAVGLRLPGHGTVPAGLTAARWEDWMAATRLAVREARARTGPGRPIHLIGYSNGGALALKHALDALEDPRLPRAERLVLISPMIGVTAFARFAGLAALPAMLPTFAKTAWLERTPEFNPFKYNSFPVSAARQTWRLTSVLQDQLRRLAAAGRLADLPPVLTFQSVADATVSTPAVLSALYGHLPANGSEVVLFDLNRSARLAPLLVPDAAALLERILPPAPRPYGVTVITNAGPPAADVAVEERSTPAGQTATTPRPLALAWPRQVYSLSHVALPFSPTDGLYGYAPDPADDFGVQLGALAPRGERGVLVVGADSLVRLTSNPFLPYLMRRIEGVAAGGVP